EANAQNGNEDWPIGAVAAIGKPTNRSKLGFNISVDASANTMAIMAVSTDSPRNWIASCLLVAPTTLRSEISRALTIARAVARLVKLKQATRRIKTPIAEKP